MFDDYVEHASSAPTSLNRSAWPKLEYQGFEPNEQDDDEPENAALVEPSASQPVFGLGLVQCAINAALVSLVVCSDILVMGLSSNTLILIELSAPPSEVIRIPIPTKQDMTLYKLFMDPSGRHIIVTSLQGENWYFYRFWKKPRQLKSFKMVIESIAWSKAALLSTSRPTSTREMLIGARNGVIYEAILDAEDDFFKSQERYLQPVFSLPERHPITGINVDIFPPANPKKALVVATTPSRIYQFIGSIDRRSEDGGRVFSALFSNYRDAAPKILELPGNLPTSELRYFTPNSNQPLSLPKSLAWMTGPGIYHGNLNFESTSDDYIDAADVLPYPTFPNSTGNTGPEIPVSVALTEFHFVILYKDRLVAICHLDNRLAYQEPLPLKPNEQVRGMTSDPILGSYWIYTDQSLFELIRTNEDRDVWRIYLEKSMFDTALEFAKSQAQQYTILAAQGDSLFAEGRYFQAAQCYSRCSVAFEKVALKFLEVGERDAFRSYLISRLEATRKTDLTQRMMLATWLVELYLSKCNELDDVVASESISHDVENLKTERAILEDDLRQFFETYRDNLEPKTTYELIQGHGRIDMYLHFASITGDHNRVIEHWILEEEWSKAIDVLNRQADLELYYRFAPVLMRNAPKETVDSWLRQPALEPARLIPALLQNVSSDASSPNQSIRYLNHLVFEMKNTSPTIHNLLVTLHTRALQLGRPDDGSLLRFLTTAPTDPLSGKPYYDLDYALRLCKQSHHTGACVHIYSKMGLWENSVDIALQEGDVELAKINADMPEDDQPLRKKLWLKIARYVVQDKKDLKTAMRFLESSDYLKIEDILPFFPDFVVIDDFKEEIAQALEGYSHNIESLRSEMDIATQTAEGIKQDIVNLKKRFVTIDAGEVCTSCSHLLMTRQFYVFPCRHTFHADCLIGLAKVYLPSHTLRRILFLQNELVKGSSTSNTGPLTRIDETGPKQPETQRTLLSTNFNPIQNGTRAANLIGRNIISAGDRLRDLIVPDALASVVSAPAWIPGMGARRSLIIADGGEKVEKLRTELEEILVSSCPLCEGVVVGLDKPFVKDGEVDNSWVL